MRLIFNARLGRVKCKRNFILLSISLLLTACGGSDGEAPPENSGGNIPPATNSAPVANFTATSTSGVAPLVSQFDGSSSSDSDGQVAAYNWDFGDGQAGAGVTVSHTYTVPGSYNAMLTVTDDDGATASSVSTILVTTSSENIDPVASFTATPTSGAAPLASQFDASSSSDSDGQITTYSWDFGDGQAGVGVTVSHTYTVPGSYNATLTVADDDGATSTSTATVSVSLGTATISGTINVVSGSVVDGDTNDPDAVYTANDTLATAQSLPNPVTLGGYLNRSGTGSAGRSFTSGDRYDYFSIGIAGGQTITLTMAEDPVAVVDLDLYLYDATGVIVHYSIGVGAVETITVPTTGAYIIRVDAFRGYSNYTLRIGSSTTAAYSSSRLVSSDAFVPGEMIVKFSDDKVAGNAALSSVSRAASLGLQMKAGGDTQRAMLMGLDERQAAFSALGIAVEDQPLQFKDAEEQLKYDTLMAIKALSKRADVFYAVPNYMHSASAVPSDPLYSSQWHYPLINLPAAWDLETGGADVTVAIIDTGVLMTHPDLQGQFSADGGYDFIRSDVISADGQPGIDSDPNDVGDNPNSFGSSSFHGTHVAGTVAAATSFSGGGVGVAGVAPGVKLMPVRVLGVGGGTSYDIIQGVLYAAGLPNDSGITLNAAERADVINMSLGRSGGYSLAEQNAYTQVRATGVIVVAAAGNNNSSTFSYPASYAGVISVSSVDRNKQKAYYSNFGTAVDVAAPGGDVRFDVDGDGFPDGVLSARADDSSGTAVANYNAIQGTSMASPHMAGVVALMKSTHSGLTPTQVDSLLSSGAIVEDIGVIGRDNIFGHGLIDANKAVIEAISLAGGTPPPSPPMLVVSPDSLNFGGSVTTTTLEARNAGGGTLNSVVVSDNASWLTVTAESVDANQLGIYRVMVDRNTITPGIYQAQITFNSSVNSVTVPVVMQVLTQAIDADAGFHHVLLIDPSTGRLAGLWEGDAQAGSYQYRFDNIPFSSGQEYYVLGGSDLDKDFLVCDPGESCGAYPSLNDMRLIGGNGPYTGLDFVTSFDGGVIAPGASALLNGKPILKLKRLGAGVVESPQY